jgi:hypothetical protein
MNGSPSRGLQHAADVLSSVFLAAATVASAWCAYQSSVWSGVERGSIAEASGAQFAASRRASEVNRDTTIDVSTFANYIAAELRGDRKLADYLRAHARPEFRPALEAWIRDVAKSGPDAPLPFARPEYRLSAQEDVDALDRRSREAMSAGNDANRNGDLFVLHTVLFSLSLFFLGSVSQIDNGKVRALMLALGALAFLVSATSMARIPRPSRVQKAAAQEAASGRSMP